MQSAVRSCSATVNLSTVAVLALTCLSMPASSVRISLVALMPPERPSYPLLLEFGLLVLPLSPSCSDESSRSTLTSSAVLVAPLNLSDVRKSRQHPTRSQCASLALLFAFLLLRLSFFRWLRMDS